MRLFLSKVRLRHIFQHGIGIILFIHWNEQVQQIDLYSRGTNNKKLRLKLNIFNIKGPIIKLKE